GRAALVADGLTYDVERLSDGMCPTSVPALYEAWPQFRGWAEGAVLDAGERLDLTALGAPSPQPRQVFGIGLNYRAHPLESGMPPSPTQVQPPSHGRSPSPAARPAPTRARTPYGGPAPASQGRSPPRPACHWQVNPDDRVFLWQ